MRTWLSIGLSYYNYRLVYLYINPKGHATIQRLDYTLCRINYRHCVGKRDVQPFKTVMGKRFDSAHVNIRKSLLRIIKWHGDDYGQITVIRKFKFFLNATEFHCPILSRCTEGIIMRGISSETPSRQKSFKWTGIRVWAKAQSATINLLNWLGPQVRLWRGCLPFFLPLNIPPQLLESIQQKEDDLKGKKKSNSPIEPRNEGVDANWAYSLPPQLDRLQRRGRGAIWLGCSK